MKTIDPEAILKKIKDKDIETKNITFRLPATLLNDFKKECKRKGVKPNSVIEELVGSFLRGLGKK